MERKIGLGRIWSFVLGFRSLVARLVPFEEGEQNLRAKTFLAMESVSSLRISAPPWWPLREGRDGECEERNEKCEFLARESVKANRQLCEFLARESVNSSPILARQWWRHFRLSLSVSLSLSLSLSLSPKVPHAQYRKPFRASYNNTLFWQTRLVKKDSWEYSLTFY